jgi:hypothetical protein
MRMRYTRSVMLVLAASSLIALGQVPKDVNGWGKIRWGMTVAQAKALYGAQARESDGGGNSTKYTEKLVIDNFAVGDTKRRSRLRLFQVQI